ncbi:right-handed parallel beta-helix repeat-containing protein [Chitinophaga rhizophila]|uniref:Right-handed parallel beta-helix repeat-containing protein n=1 Tax=Chitinophaga rhizophila TaxID=2866212 RepID=A0ABS7GH77_9BACT|nr:right-handed parallel beta-helix repeat-containing protein [Chitinophaga rhizophila]MBW8687042.1 right-handed parallel beta-helix repeat-containing protein [Chitinophaga rhizophila]
MKNAIVCLLLATLFSCTKKEVEQPADTATPEQLLAITNYYVNGASGNDANTGTSATAALKTIQAALNKTAEGAGSTIYVAAGTYKERLSWPHSGASSTEPITLTNYSGGTVILDGVGATNDAQNAMISISSKSHVRVNNIRIANNIRSFAAGIYVSGSGTDVQVTSCRIYNIGWTTDSTAVPTASNNANPLVVVGTTATAYSGIYFGSNQVYACNTGFSEAMTLSGNVNNFLIENNIVHHIRNIGIDMTGHYSWTGAPDSVNFARNGNVKGNVVYNCISPVATSGGIYVDGGKWINVEGNTSFNNGAGITVGCENANRTAEGINIRSNFIYNNKEAGLVIGSNAAGSKVTWTTASNNTLFKNYTNGGWGGEISLQNTDQVTISNNIVQSASNIVVIALLGYTTTNLAMNYNRYYTQSGTANTITFDWGGINGTTYGSLAAFQSGTGLDAQSTYGIPSFVSSAAGSLNLHLASGSACINAGNPAFVPASGELDIDKQSRKQNNRVDIGADETAL